MTEKLEETGEQEKNPTVEKDVPKTEQKEMLEPEKSPEELKNDSEKERIRAEKEYNEKIKALKDRETNVDTDFFKNVLKLAEEAHLGDNVIEDLFNSAKEKGLNIERIKNEREFNQVKHENMIENNQIMDKELLDMIFDPNRKLDNEEDEEFARAMDYLCYSNNKNVTYSETYFDEKRDHMRINCHEFGHILFKNKDLIYSQSEVKALNSMSENLTLENIADWNNLPENFRGQTKEILDIFQDESLLGKESEYIIERFNKIKNKNGEMEEARKDHNRFLTKHKRKPIQKLEDYINTVARRELMEEIIAERASFYFMAKEITTTDEKGSTIRVKNPLDMLTARIERAPNIQEYLGINKDNKDDYEKLKKVLGKIEITNEVRKKHPELVIEEVKKSGINLEKMNLDNLSKLLTENQKFFDHFEEKLKGKTSEDIRKAIKENPYNDDELEDLFDCMDYGTGEFSSIGNGRGPEKGFLDSIIDLFKMIFQIQ